MIYFCSLQIVREHVRPECKCHGVSGSCGTKTCWYKMAPFSEVGAILKQRYMRAQRVQLNTAARNSELNIPESQMVFLENSPDYCKPNSSLGMLAIFLILPFSLFFSL